MGRANAECLAIEQAIRQKLTGKIGKAKLELEVVKNNRAFRVDVPPQTVEGGEVQKLHLVHPDREVLVNRVAKKLHIVEPEEKPRSRFNL